jgi:hypothetical protein
MDLLYIKTNRKEVMKIQKDEICFNCYGNEISIEIETQNVFCSHCGLTSTMLKSELGTVYKNEREKNE